jgi:tRNA uridine 5-carboxymethylaminomethyl modification enzyme
MQNDRQAYRLAMKRLLEGGPRLPAPGARRAPGATGPRRPGGGRASSSPAADIRARAVVLATGTFLNGLIHIGDCARGRAGEASAAWLQLRELGFEVGRLKTGTAALRR